MKSITEEMRFRQRLCEYALKHGVTKAARRYHTNRQFVYRQLEKLAPAEYWEYLEDESDVSMKDVEEQMEELNKTLIRGLEDEYGDNIKVSYKILEKDDASSSDLDEMKDYIKSNYDIPKKSVTDAVELEVELTVRGDDDEETTESTFYAVKVGGDWYICSANGAFLGI